MLNALAVDEGFIFAIGESFVIYRYSTLTGDCGSLRGAPEGGRLSSGHQGL